MVSIITSVYNCEDYVHEMIDSILNQTYSDWEMIIIDDASTDNTWEKVSQYNDHRIIKIRNNNNVGLTINLNKALSICRGDYIVRIDGDDIACSERLEKQVKYMDEHSDVVLSGGWMQSFGNAHGIFRSALEDDILKINLLFNAIMFHPTFIIRKECLESNKIKYNEQLRYAQDYNLEYQLGQVGKLANIPEIVMKYRIHRGQVSCAKRYEQKKNADFTRRLLLGDLGITLSDIEMEYWSRFCLLDYHELDMIEKKCIEKIGKLILTNNILKELYPQELLENILQQRIAEYFAACEKAIETKKQDEVNDKYFSLFAMMNQWVKIKQEEKKIESFLKQHNYYAIAIYGMGEIGETLLRELCGSDIVVKYGIDRRASSIFANCKVVSPETDLDEIDAIVVTAITYYDEIEEQLKRRVNCPIISLEKILFEL